MTFAELDRSRRWIVTSASCFALFLLGVFSPTAQEQITVPPRVNVIPPSNLSGNPEYDSLSQTMADTVAFSLRLLGEYRVETVSLGVSERVAIGDPESMSEFATQVAADYIVLGELTAEDGGGIAFDVGVWDSSTGEVTIRRESVAPTLFDTFDVADELSLELVSALSGRRIAYGTLEIDVPSTAQSYVLFVDGEYAGFGTRRLNQVPAGERIVAVAPYAGDPDPLATIRRSIVVEPEAVTSVSFDLEDTGADWRTPELIDYAAGNELPPEDTEIENAEIPDWFDGGFAVGINPDATFFDVSAVRDIVGDSWFHEPTDWTSRAARFPIVDWTVDGSIREWPWTIPYFPFDPRQDPDAAVRVLQYSIAYAVDAVYFTLRLGGQWSDFFRNDEPAIFLETTMYNDGAPTRRNFSFGRINGRWEAQSRINRNPYEDHPFGPLAGARVATDEERVEIRIPIESFDGDRFMEITDITLERLEADWEVLFRSGPPLPPRFERRVEQ